MKVLLLEPFFSGSHQRWAEGYQAHSRHEVKLLTMKGRHWKWRMYGGAVHLATKFLEGSFHPDLILATDMLDLATFLGLAHRRIRRVPVVAYFHENQITYPWSPADRDVGLKRDQQYGYINFTTCLAANVVLFNSDFHRQDFLGSLPDFLRQFPDAQGLQLLPAVEQKSHTLPLGMGLRQFDLAGRPAKMPEAVILWNHRWEYDKGADEFFRLLYRLKADGHRFRLIVLGAAFQRYPPVFDEAHERLRDEIIHWGYAEDRQAYASLLWQADLLPVVSRQDFFGGSVVEALYCGCYPLLPNRLAYPMHLPEEKKHNYLYENEEDLYEKLRRAVQNIESIRQQAGLRDFVARYDWSNLAPDYDGLLEEVRLPKK